MGQKMMLEATQSVVDGNQVVVHSGDLFASMDKVPEGVPVRPVLVDAPDEKQPAGAPPQVPADAKPAAKTK